MISHYLEFDPAMIEKRQVYRLLTGAVVPRPIGWASTLSKSGVPNLAPFSFFTVVCVIPPMISLTIARNPDGSEKHTLKNVRETGEFCFNVVTEQVWREMVDSANALSGRRFRVQRNRSHPDSERQNRSAARQRGSDPFRVQARACP